jgi:hypothetical protein
VGETCIEVSTTNEATPIRAAWAAGLWTRAFEAKPRRRGSAAALTKTEAKERGRLAGL